MEEKVLEILKGVKSNVDYLKEDGLVDKGIIESFDIIQIMTALMDEFSISIEATDIEPENVNSYKAICDLVRRKMA